MLSRCEIDEELAASAGVEPAALERLGKVIVFAGPNGGGKTRYLNLVYRYAHDAISRHTVVRGNQQSAAQLPPVDENDPRAATFARTIREQIASPIYRNLEVPEGAAVPQVVRLSYPQAEPRNEDITNVTALDLETKATTVRSGDFAVSYVGMHAYVAAHAKALWEGQHPDLAANDELRRRKERAEKFNEVFSALLGRSIGARHNGVVPLPVVGDRVFAPGEFSHGERVLVSWAIMLFEQGASLANAIVLLDEPDVHLHADVCSQALRRLRAAIGPNGQMWIATHSVPLIADVGFDNLYFVRDGRIEIASRRADRVVNSLLGGDGARSTLLEFLVDAEKIAQIRFLLECLLEPGVASPVTGDRQQAQFTKLVAKRLSKSDTVRILEYGCGKARFAAALADWLAEQGTVLMNRVEYHAFEDAAHHEPSVAAACHRNVAALGVDPSLHVWNDISTLNNKHSGRFDLVILCNTLHEIPPSEWPRIVTEIESLLCESGTLVVMEDLFPSVGELPNQTGFVILNEAALQKLFGAVDAVSWSETHDNRVMVAEIPRRFLNVTSASRDAALTKVCEQALEGIRRIRAKGPSSRTHHDGRAHAVWAMQFANATLALA